MYKLVKKIKLNGKDKSHAKLLIRNLIRDIIIHGKILTTLAKAKVLKSEFDKIVTIGKKGTEASRRLVKSFFGNNQRITNRFFKVINTYLADRSSGYTRLIKTLPRQGDNASMAYVCIVNMENYKEEKRKTNKEIDKLLKKKSSSNIRNKVKQVLQKNN